MRNELETARLFDVKNHHSNLEGSRQETLLEILSKPQTPPRQMNFFKAEVKSTSIEIFPLAEKIEHYDTIINWNIHEWGSYFKNPAEETQKQYEERLTLNAPPIAYVVLAEIDGKKVPIATFSLVHDVYQFYNDGAPRLFLSRLLIDEKYRKQGFGTAIVRQAEALSEKFGYEKLHLFTLASERLENFYEKLGWVIIEIREWNNAQIFIMTRALLAQQAILTSEAELLFSFK